MVITHFIHWLFTLVLTVSTLAYPQSKIIMHIGDSHVVPNVTTSIIKDSLKTKYDTVETYVYAMNGKTYSYFIKNKKTLISKLNNYNPNIVIISLGTNDYFNGNNKINFKKQVISLIDIIKNSDSTIKIILTSPPNNKHHDNMETCANILKEISEENKNIYFCDILNESILYDKYIQKDKVHYKNVGYKIIGQIIYNFIIKNKI